MIQGKSYARRVIFDAIGDALGGEKGKDERKIVPAKAQPGERRTEPTLTDLLDGGLFGA